MSLSTEDLQLITTSLNNIVNAKSYHITVEQLSSRSNLLYFRSGEYRAPNSLYTRESYGGSQFERLLFGGKDFMRYDTTKSWHMTREGNPIPLSAILNDLKVVLPALGVIDLSELDFSTLNITHAEELQERAFTGESAVLVKTLDARGLTEAKRWRNFTLTIDTARQILVRINETEKMEAVQGGKMIFSKTMSAEFSKINEGSITIHKP